MDDLSFLKMIFHGYVISYGAHRWHRINSYTDMTENELCFFSDLGTKLGFISIREYERKDLVWLDPEDNNRIILHLERENESWGALNCFFTENKLKASAKICDGRFLLGVFGFVTEQDYKKIKGEILANEIYRGRNILIISFVGQTKNNAMDCFGFISSQHRILERRAKATLDKADYWYLHFERKNDWQETT